MKHHTKPFFLVFFFLALVLTVLLSDGQERNSMFGNPVISIDELEELIAEKEMTEVPVDLFSYEEQALPYIADTNTFLLPIEKPTERVGILKAGNYGSVYVLACEERNDLNESYPIYVINETSCIASNIAITNTAVMTFETEEFENENAYGTLQLFMPKDNEIGTYSYKTSSAKLSYDISNGIVTSKERNYSLKLVTEYKDGATVPNKLNLAGLRKDDDWELDSLHGCANEILDFYWQWNQFCISSGQERFQILYQNVDFYLDGVYAGPYLLRVPIDDKQLNGVEGNWILNSDISTTIYGDQINKLLNEAITESTLSLECYFREEKKEEDYVIYAIPRRFKRIEQTS